MRRTESNSVKASRKESNWVKANSKSDRVNVSLLQPFSLLLARFHNLEFSLKKLMTLSDKKNSSRDKPLTGGYL